MKPYSNKSGFFHILLLVAIVLYAPVNLQATECPQARNTLKAPVEYLEKKNPLRKEPRHIKKGKVLAHIKAKPLACKQCHGMAGNGEGPMSLRMNPKPRNFTCDLTMDGISDGQLFWIIKNGSKGTSMPAYKHLPDKKIWQLIHYIRSLNSSIS